MALLWLNFRSSVIVIAKMLGDLLKIQIVGNKAKGEFKNGGNKKTNHAKFSEKNPNISQPLIHTRTCTYQGAKNVWGFFSENLAWFVFLLSPFWDMPFALLSTKCSPSLTKMIQIPCFPTSHQMWCVPQFGTICTI